MFVLCEYWCLIVFFFVLLICYLLSHICVAALLVADIFVVFGPDVRWCLI
jgi:hypothetical protein